MSRLKVLIVDDEVVYRTMLATALKDDQAFAPVRMASEGAMALAAIDAEMPDVVTLDLDMPVMNGMNTLVEIRRRHPGLPVVVLSAFARPGMEELDVLTMGADDFLTKPATFDELVARLSVAEHTLHLERGMKHLEGFIGACPSCHSVRRPDGRWMPMRSFVATMPPPERPDECPSCFEAQERDGGVDRASGCPA